MSAWVTAGIVIATIAGGLGLVGACSAALVKGGRFVAQIVRFLDTWNGHGDGPYRTLSMPERMDRQDAELARIRSEVMPNHGASMRDAVDQLNARLDAHLADADETHRDFIHHLRGHDGSH